MWERGSWRRPQDPNYGPTQVFCLRSWYIVAKRVRVRPRQIHFIVHFSGGVKTFTRDHLSQFSREICSFEEKVKSQKIFRIEFSTKMVLMKICVTIILTELERFESKANVKKTSTVCRGSRLRNVIKESLRIRENFIYVLKGWNSTLTSNMTSVLTTWASKVRFGLAAYA